MISTEPAPFSGDLRIKTWWINNDYDRIVKLLIGKVDAHGQILYNLTRVDKDTYQWEEVKPDDYQNQLVPILELEQATVGSLYKSLLEHLIQTGYLAPPATTAAEDVERKMLAAENEFLKELLTVLAGTRKSESWHTISTKDPTSELQRQYIEIENELIQRIGPQIRDGMPTTSGASGSTGHGVQGSPFGSSTSYGPSSTPYPKAIPEEGTTDEPYRPASWSWDSQDRGGL